MGLTVSCQKVNCQKCRLKVSKYFKSVYISKANLHKDFWLLKNHQTGKPVPMFSKTPSLDETWPQNMFISQGKVRQRQPPKHNI